MWLCSANTHFFCSAEWTRKFWPERPRRTSAPSETEAEVYYPSSVCCRSRFPQISALRCLRRPRPPLDSALYLDKKLCCMWGRDQTPAGCHRRRVPASPKTEFHDHGDAAAQAGWYQAGLLPLLNLPSTGSSSSDPVFLNQCAVAQKYALRKCQLCREKFLQLRQNSRRLMEQ